MSHSAVTPYLYKGDERVPLANHTQDFPGKIQKHIRLFQGLTNHTQDFPRNFQRHQKFLELTNYTRHFLREFLRKENTAQRGIRRTRAD